MDRDVAYGLGQVVRLMYSPFPLDHHPRSGSTYVPQNVPPACSVCPPRIAADSVGPLMEPPRKPFARESLGLALVAVAGLQDDEVVPIDEIDQPMLVVDAT